MYILGMVLFILSWWASGAEAACSGSGTSWNCTAGTTRSASECDDCGCDRWGHGDVCSGVL